jgi:hypothetical protein
MGAYANLRNNDLPFVNGGISAYMESVQPQKGFYHEVVFVSACTIFIIDLGASLKTCDEYSAVCIRTHPQTI